MGNLSNLYISQSFQSLIHLGTNNTASAALIDLQDGYGNNIGVAVNTAGDLFLSGSLTASLQQGYLYVGNASGKTSAFATSSLVATVDTGSLVTTASFNAFTQSINSATQSLFTSASLGLTTASFSGNTLTFTKGNGTTFGIVIPDVSGSTIDTGSFATTSSFNSYTQSTNIRLNNLESTSASVNVSITNLNSTTSSFATSIANLNSNSASVNTSITNLNASSASQQVSIDALNTFTASQSTASIVTSINNLNTFSASALVSISNINTTTASLLVETQNLELFSASALISISNLNASSASQQISIDNLNQKTGSYATTGSNNFTGSESITGSLSLIGPFVLSDGGNASSIVTRSGSILFVGAGFTSGSTDLAHISSSGNQINFFMKNSNTAQDTIISGSGNIFLNPAAATAGFKRYMTGGNIAVGGQGQAIPQISASMAWSPIIANNVFANSGNSITFRGPISSSSSILNNNIFAGGTLNLGTAAATNFEKTNNGINVSATIINGTINTTAYKTNLSGSFNISNSSIGGTLNLNQDSSSISVAGLLNQGSTTINNLYFNSAAGTSNALTIQRNAIFGTTTNIYASGSNTATSVARIIEGNIFSGIFNSASVNLNGDASHLQATAIIGHGLNVTGSSQRVNTALTQSVGSAFFGRHNDQLGNKAKSAETIFAVGTGTPTVPKTGFLIDSGSNTYVEGSLNVSGSTVFTGSVKVAPTFQLNLPTGSNQQVGTAVLDNASPSMVVVSNTSVTANSIIMVSKQTLTNAHSVAVSSKGAGTFTIQSTGNGDSDTVGWVIWNNT